MFNAQRYMHTNDAYFAPSTVRFPYELKKILDRILHELQFLHHDSPLYLLYLLEKLVDGLYEERTRPPPLRPISTTTL